MFVLFSENSNGISQREQRYEILFNLFSLHIGLSSIACISVNISCLENAFLDWVTGMLLKIVITHLLITPILKV